MAECASVCEHLHLPLQSGSDRTLARMHRGYTAARYLERLAAARAAIPDLAVTTDLIVGFPGETEDDFARTLDVVEAAGYDAAYTFMFSPRPGTEAADNGRRLRSRRGRRRSGCSGSPKSSNASARAGTRRASARTEEVLLEGPSKKDPSVWSGRTPPQQARARRAARRGALPRRRVRRGARHARRAALAAGRATSAGAPARTAGSAHPRVGRRLRDAAPRPRRPDRDREVRARRSRSRARGSATSRSSRSTRCRCIAGWTSAPPSRRPPSATRCGIISSTSPIRRRSGRSCGRRQLARDAIADIEARGKRALLVGGTGPVRARGRRRPRDPRPGPRGAGRAAWRDRRRPAASPPRTRGCDALDPVAAARIEPSNRRRIVRALEVIDDHRPAVLVVRSRLRRRTAARARRHAGRTVAAACRRSPTRIEARFAAMRAAGLVDEVRAPAGADPAGCRALRRRRSATPRCSRTCAAKSRRSTPRSPGPCGGRASSLAVSGCGSGGTPASSGSPGPPRIRATGARDPGNLAGSGPRDRPMTTMRLSPSSTPPATTSSSASTSTTPPAELDARAVAALCDRHRGIGADGLITRAAGRHGADCAMTLRERRRWARRDERERDPLSRVGRRAAGLGAGTRARRSTPRRAGARTTSTATASRGRRRRGRHGTGDVRPRRDPGRGRRSVRPRGRRRRRALPR